MDWQECGPVSVWYCWNCMAERGAETAKTQDPEPPPKKRGDPKLADKLRALADGMQTGIDERRTPSEQNPTPRREKIAKSRREDADWMEDVQSVLNELSDLARDGSTPPILEKVRTRALIEDLVHQARSKERYGDEFKVQVPSYNDEKSRSRATMAGLLLPERWAAAVDMVNCFRHEPTPETSQEKGARLEREIAIGCKIPGFFPTPSGLADIMAGALQLEPGDVVLDPSAGTGSLLDAVRRINPDQPCEAIERSETLREVLVVKQYPLSGRDALALEGSWPRIIMNPPFENGQDVQHVQHAYEHLEQGGCLVAVMCEGVFFRTDAKAKGFREWFERHGGSSEKLNPGQFNGAKALRQTGVATRMVWIEKAAVQEKDKPFASEKEQKETEEEWAKRLPGKSPEEAVKMGGKGAERLGSTPYPDGLPGHARDNEASLENAVKVAGGLKALQAKVLNGFWRMHGCASLSEIQDLTTLNRYTAAPRITELKELGLVFDTRRKCGNDEGNSETVWALSLGGAVLAKDLHVGPDVLCSECFAPQLSVICLRPSEGGACGKLACDKSDGMCCACCPPDDLNF